jgi:hypothetical protein
MQVPFRRWNPGGQLSGVHLLVLGSKVWSLVHGDGGAGEHGIASAIVGHGRVHDELFGFVSQLVGCVGCGLGHDGSLGFIVQLVGCGLGHDGSLGFMVQKPALPTSLVPPMSLPDPPKPP